MFISQGSPATISSGQADLKRHGMILDEYIVRTKFWKLGIPHDIVLVRATLSKLLSARYNLAHEMLMNQHWQ
jgi:hypothetical protein